MEQIERMKELRRLVYLLCICLTLSLVMFLWMFMNYTTEVNDLRKEVKALELYATTLEDKLTEEIVGEVRHTLKAYEQIYSGILKGIQEEW